MTPDDVRALADLGPAGVLLLALLGGARGWWVFGWQYSEMRRERDTWRELALHGTKVAERAVRVAERGDLRVSNSD